MKTRFICLANSFKEGGKCLAGVEIDEQGKPIINLGGPKWIRPVGHTVHGEIPTHLAAPFHILDIIEIDGVVHHPEGYQSENVLFDENSLRRVGIFTRNQLVQLCDTHNLIFGNRGKAVSQEAIRSLTYSLMLIYVHSFEIAQRTFEDNPNYPKTRIQFINRGVNYDLPVTDPVFLYRHKSDPHFYEGLGGAYLSLSLSVEWQNWYYKLAAGIILEKDDIQRDDLLCI
jgi:hypothetical protein